MAHGRQLSSSVALRNQMMSLMGNSAQSSKDSMAHPSECHLKPHVALSSLLAFPSRLEGTGVRRTKELTETTNVKELSGEWSLF